MVDIRVRLASSPFSGIDAEIRCHVFMHFFLQIDAHGAIGPNHLIRTNAGISGHVSAGIRQANISWIVTNRMLCAVKRRSGKLVEKSLPRLLSLWKWPKLRCKHSRRNQRKQRQRTAFIPATLHSQGLTPDNAPEFPESTCETTSRRPWQKRAPAQPGPRVLPNRESFLPSPSGTASWKSTRRPRS